MIGLALFLPAACGPGPGPPPAPAGVSSTTVASSSAPSHDATSSTAATRSTGPTSGVRGTVLFSPTCPVERDPPDPACAPRPGVVDITVVRPDGSVAGAATSGADGHFVVPAPSGTYTVVAFVSGPSIGRGCDVEPSQVTLTAGAVSEIAVRCDTGIR